MATTQQFTATGTYSDSTTGNVTSSVTWSSSNTAVATISNAGLATSIAAGSTTITATSGSISGSTTLTTSNVGAVLQTTGPFGALMVGKGGEMLLPIVDRDASGNATKVTGALYMNNDTGTSAVVYLGDDGKPTKTVMGDYILLFSNWSANGTTVDIAKIYTPTNYIEVFKGVSVNANIAAKEAKRKVSSDIAQMTCLPKCGNDTKTLAELVKVAGLGISLGLCVPATTLSLGAMAIPCAGLVVSTASFVMGDEAWLGIQGMEAGFLAMDTAQCIGANVASCVSTFLGVGSQILDIYGKELVNNSNLVNTASLFVSDPNQHSGVVQQGGGLPSVPSGEYECTPGGAMHYVPCLLAGVRECQNDYTWGPCMCDGSLCGSQTCTYTYSDWSACQPDNTQTRTVISSSPPGCVGTPVLSQSCTYTHTPVCGDGICDAPGGENSINCPSDCGSSSSCGGSGETFCMQDYVGFGCGITLGFCCNTDACWYVVNESSTYCCAGTDCAAAAQTVANIVADACAL